jgi:ABC-2 type transport system ATP-binding protein
MEEAMAAVIQVEQLRKVYGDTVAVDDVSFSVEGGEIFGIVGPNGAGKTTTVESIVGLRRPDKGTIRALGLDPTRQEDELQERIGVQLQEAALPELIKVWEALDLFSAFFRKAVDWEPLLDQWGLSDKRNARFGKLSGGQKHRLFVALALLNDPEAVFLDELTAGLDPQARRDTWDLVRAIRDQGKTVVLVTHFMDEAQELCDRVAIIDHGRIVALDTPQALIQQIQAESEVSFTAPPGFDSASLKALPEVKRVSEEGGKVSVFGEGALLARVATELAQQNLAPSDMRSVQVTLEDVFLALTGREIRD